MTPGKLYRLSKYAWERIVGSDNFQGADIWAGLGPVRNLRVTIQREQIFLYLGERKTNPKELGVGDIYTVGMFLVGDKTCKYYSTNLDEHFSEIKENEPVPEPGLRVLSAK